MLYNTLFPFLNFSRYSNMPLHVFFIPFMAQGHFVSMIDLAKLFADRGVKVAIVTTPLNAPLFRNTIASPPIQIHVLPFSPSTFGLPDECYDLHSISSFETFLLFMSALDTLQDPLEKLVQRHQPNCIVSDSFLPWTAHVAHRFNLPRLVFTGTGLFPLCVGDAVARFAPHEKVASDTDVFTVPGLPHEIELTPSQIPDFTKTQEGFRKHLERAMESDRKSFGFVANTFQELEVEYVEHYKKKMGGGNAWLVGPLGLCNRNRADAVERGEKDSISAEDCLKWLDGKQRSTVVYVCFGSLCRFASAQLAEIALAIEESQHSYIWVVGNSEQLQLPDGYEERLKGKVLVLKGWAPQVLILNHPTVGAFVTHCGWNSILEGVTAGVPMVTWPVFGEQFYNEKLVTQVLKIGVAVGSRCWLVYEEEKRPVLERKEIRRAVDAVMDGGDEAEGMRKRAKALGEMALRAVQVGGTSHVDISRLTEELEMYGQKERS